MSEELISVIEAAKQLGKCKQTFFKVIKRLKIVQTKQRQSEHRGQAIAYITTEDFKRIVEYLSINQNSIGKTDMELLCDASLTDIGVFYLIQLEPNHDPSRFKVGFATIMSERLQKHRCSAPFATVIGNWPCRRLWEQTAIDCVTADCERIYTEVFRTNAIKDIKNKCDQFFALMPRIWKNKK